MRVDASRLFAPGSATLLPDGAALLQTLGTALHTEPGRFDVIGYTDNRPFRSVKFPSSFQLSAAQAASARDALAAADAAADAKTEPQPARWSSEGRAGGYPLATNATADGRQQNHRLDIVMDRPS